MKRSVVLFLIAMLVVVSTPVFAQPDGLHTAYDAILKAFVTNGRVDYAALKINRSQLDSYLDRLGRIDKEEFDAWSMDARLAYLINLYNAATLKLIVDHYPVKSIKYIGSFFKGPWDLSVVERFGETITLNTLEHDIIRKQYREPRVHMALVCAARGCPPLRSEAYTARALDRQLDNQSRIYLSSPEGMRIDRSAGKVYLSSIFKWYREDFSSVTGFAEAHTGQKLEGLTLRWIDYDWTLNGQ